MIYSIDKIKEDEKMTQKVYLYIYIYIGSKFFYFFFQKIYNKGIKIINSIYLLITLNI